ncbi:hypothetical protein ACEPAG_1586 [Sanghuangporus baumii]
MMFNLKSTLTFLIASSLPSLIHCAPAPAQQDGVKTSSPVVNIVYNPMITYPTAGVVWTVGERKTITWKTDEIPDELKNSTGTILLGYNEEDSENLDIAHPLATGFNLSDGQVNVTVPDDPARSDYIVVLFGDSGNASPEFTIKSAASASASATGSATATATATATASILPSTSATDSLGSGSIF